MQIDSAVRSAVPEQASAVTTGSTAQTDAATVEKDTANQTDSGSSSTSTQDDAVQISTEGAAAARDANSSDSTDDSASATNVSAMKSFTYGTLGLERPDLPQENHNAFYTAGRWLAAGITIGGVISLLA